MPATPEDFLTHFTTGLDLDYSDEEKSSLSNLRVAERLRELGGLDRIIQTNTQGVEALAETRIVMARTDLSDQLSRIRDLTQAEESAQGLRRQLLGALEDKLKAMGTLQAGRVSALLGDNMTPSSSSGSSLSATNQPKRPTSFKV